METFMNKIRVIFSGTEEQNKADLGGIRDQKIPIQKTQSFKEKKKAPNWFQRQISRKMSDYDSMEHATAVAAAAFAISSQEVSEIPEKRRISKPHETSLTKTRSKVDGTRTPISLAGAAARTLSGSFRSTSGQGYKVPISSAAEEKKPEKTITPAPSMKKNVTFNEKKNSAADDIKPETAAPNRTPTFGDKNFVSTDEIQPETPAPRVPPPVHHPEPSRPPPQLQPLPPPPPSRPTPQLPPPPPPPTITQTSTPIRSPPLPPSGTKARPSNNETKADAWERNQLQNIKERYENLMETIDTWEKRKKMRARRKLNKQEQSANERKRAKASKKYEAKMKYIDEIAVGARAEANTRRRNEELKAKEKANIIRTTGQLPRYCSCF